MKTRLRLLCSFVMISFVGEVFGQEVDTLGLTGTVGDTIIAKRFLNEAIELNKRSEYTNALIFADIAERIFTKQLGVENKGVADALYQKGRNQYAIGRYNECLELCEKSLIIRLRLFGELNNDVASSYNYKGMVYNQIGKYDTALIFCQRGLQIRLKALDPQDPNIAWSYHNIGWICEKKGDYNNALDNNKKALQIRLKVLGSEHQDVAWTYNNMGANYSSMGQYDSAFIFHEKALQIRLKIFEPEHPDIAWSYYNIGLVLDKEGNYQEAMENYEKSLQIRLKALGEDHPDVAWSYQNIGWIHDVIGEYDSALTCYEKALQIRVKALDSDHPDVASAYLVIGGCYVSKGEYDKSLPYFEKAIQIQIKTLGEEHPNIATNYYSVARALALKCDYNKAFLYYKKALQMQVKILGPEHPDVALSYDAIGSAYKSKGEYDTAFFFCEKALQLRLSIFGADHPDVAWSYNSIGEIYSFKGEYDKALTNYEKSLQIRLSTFGPDHIDVAQLYDNISDIFFFIGKYEKTLSFYEHALQIRLNVLGPKHPDVAWSYQNIGTYFADTKGEYDKAIIYYEKALQIRLKAQGVEHPDIAYLYQITGAAYASKGEYEKALSYTEKSLAIRSLFFGPEHTSIANCYQNLGWIFDMKGDYDKALEYYEKAIYIRLKIFDPEHPDLQYLYTNIGTTYMHKKDYNEALVSYLKDLDITFKSMGGENINTAASFNNLANIYYLQKNNAKCIDSYQKALASNSATLDSISEVRTDKSTYVSSLLGMALYYKEQKNFTEATKYCDRIIDVIKDLYINHSLEADKILFIKDQYSIFENIIEINKLYLETTWSETVKKLIFTYAEISKANLLQANFKDEKARSVSRIPDSLLQQEHSLRIDITWREKQRQALLEKGLSETDTNTLRVSSIIFDLKRDYEALKKRFETDYPKYFHAKYDLSTVSLVYVQDTLLQPNQTLLEYFVGDSSIYLFVVRPDTMIIQEVKRDFPLDDWIEQFRHGLYGFYAAPEAQQTDALKAQCLAQYLEFSPKLYQKLFAPVQEFIPEQDAVIVVPDGPLGYIPFDALLTAAPKVRSDFKSYPYLLHKYQFSYTYSATLLKEMRDKKHHHEPSKVFAAFAPFYTGDTLVFAQDYSYVTRKNFDPLPYSKEEVGQARKKMGGDIVSGLAATETRFVEMAGDYRILHLATHGVADNRVGDYAYLAFSEIKDSIENEFLYVKDLYNLELNADLVVLSACETGVGKLQRGEGIISLARAFAYAGAKSIVTSLWSVNDRSTTELMGHFYTELKAGKPKDKALHDARLAFLKTDNVRICHPFFWAAFVPVGDMRATADGGR